MSRTSYENETKEFKGRIGCDEFGINRIYVKIEDIPEDMLNELKTKMDFQCSDCGQDVAYLVINMVGFTDPEAYLKGRQTHTDMYFDCGVCAVG